MSRWTHVAAVVRLDALRFTEYRTRQQRKKIREIFGKECLYESDEEVWADVEQHPEKYLPMGSEGSLKMKIYTNPDMHCLSAYTVTIFGDLRDAGYNKQELEDDYINWFKQKLHEVSDWFGVRQATITATNGIDTVNYTYKMEE